MIKCNRCATTLDWETYDGPYTASFQAWRMSRKEGRDPTPLLLLKNVDVCGACYDALQEAIKQAVTTCLGAQVDAENIKCPVCGHVWDEEGRAFHSTFDGGYGARDDECPECETVLTIECHECVTWHFEVKVKAAEDGG